MPIYVFECEACRTRVEQLAPIGFEKTCPECQTKMRKIIAAASIVIGSGQMSGKVRDRVTLDDELKREGTPAPLFSSETRKDRVRWALRKEGLIKRVPKEANYVPIKG